jgi:uncharacterized protein (TIRG00374 family)
LAGRFRFDEDRAADVLKHLGSRLQGLAADRKLLVRVLVWASINWLLDAASLWVFLSAFGETMPPDALIIAFGLANIMAVVPITPGGLGIVESIFIPTLVGFGATRSGATRRDRTAARSASVISPPCAAMSAAMRRAISPV